MNTPSIVRELVERFRENQEQYTTGTYKEFRLRKEFVDPLLECLGWDLANKSGYAEAYKDVVHEDSIKVSGITKAPDYAFRIGGTRKFFVETKAPAVDIKDNPDPAYQLRRYGWSAKLPLSILTNFAELAVYDCRIRPDKSDKASKARIAYMTFEEYLTRWDELEGVFSKRAISKGSFDKFAEDTTRKRGTAQVDEAFLAEIEEWREALAKNLALRNPGLSVHDLNTAVQRTIDRIIFLRIAEDRGIEQYGRLKGLTRGRNIYDQLTKIFLQADARYNSGLFHFNPSERSNEPADTLTLNLSIDDKVLKEIFTSLYYPESPYEFSVLPADILGQVYEQFLGKVIRLFGRSAIVEEKPEVKKAGGVFYTPTFVVRHIAREVLSPLLRGKTPKQIGALDKRSKEASLKILDPACGSGSFLIEAYQFLLDWYTEQYLAVGPEKHAKGRDAKLYKSNNGEWRLTINEKRRILLSHIYGVDIDPQAVEVSKLSLLLKVLENENADLIAAQMKLFHMRALPDLGQNIKCGNSLISNEIYDAYQENLFSNDDRVRINAFDWADEFPFAFDAVIGNPPYGADYTETEKAIFQRKFSYRRGKPETYLFFLEQGLQLLRTGGRLGFIVPNAWLSNYYGIQIRTLLLSQNNITEVVDLEPIKVFRDATVDTCIILLKKDKPTSRAEVTISRVGVDRKIRTEFKIYQSQWTQDDQKIFNVYASAAELRIMTKMEASRDTLGSVVDYSQGVIPYKTKDQGKKNEHIASAPRDRSWKPLLESAAQVAPYRLEKPEAFIHYGRWLWCARDPKYFERPKILFHRLRKKLPRQLIGAIDESGIINRHALSNLILLDGHERDELWAVLALLNSDLANWWFVKRFGPLMEVGGFKIQTIPLPQDWGDAWPSLASKAKDITEALASIATSKSEQLRAVRVREVQSYRRYIEKRLARGYGLTDDEVLSVESSFHSLIERSTTSAITDDGESFEN